jgi:hypothetical protein
MVALLPWGRSPDLIPSRIFPFPLLSRFIPGFLFHLFPPPCNLDIPFALFCTHLPGFTQRSSKVTCEYTITCRFDPTSNADIMIVALDNCRSTTDLGVFDCSRHAILDRLTCTLYSLYGCLLISHLTPPSGPRVEVDPLIDFTASLNIKHSLHTSPDIANTYYRILMCP